MKKFMFSIIAMIAFVGSSMASDIAEKELLLNNLETSSYIEKEDNETLRENCDLVKYRSYNLARELGYTVEEANVISYQKYFGCAFNNSKEI
jgi:hypothetical protein